MAAQLELALGGLLQASTASTCASKKRGIGEWEDERLLQLMMGPVERPSSNSSYSIISNNYKQQQQQQPQRSHFNTTPIPIPTLDLFGKGRPTSPPPPPPPPQHHEDDDVDKTGCCFELDSHSPLPPGWEKCLDLMTGSIYYLNRSTGLSTSCDPRKATTSVNWPTSPSSSSDLTFEANVPTISSKSKPMSKEVNGDGSNASNQLDLNLSLRPSSLSLPKGSLNNDQTRNESIHNLRSLTSSHGLLSNQSFTSCSTLPLNATASNSKSSTALATCATFSATTSTPSSSSPSTLSLQEINALKDARGSLAPSTASKFELEQIKKPISINHYVISKSEPFSNNPSINVNSKLLSNNLPSSPMITVGCANCLMFVMLPKSCDPKCPRCGASIDSDLPPLPSKKAKLGFTLKY